MNIPSKGVSRMVGNTDLPTAGKIPPGNFVPSDIMRSWACKPVEEPLPEQLARAKQRSCQDVLLLQNRMRDPEVVSMGFTVIRESWSKVHRSSTDLMQQQQAELARIRDTDPDYRHDPLYKQIEQSLPDERVKKIYEKNKQRLQDAGYLVP